MHQKGSKMASLLLKHDNFLVNHAGFYQKLLKDHEFSDVTLACEGFSIQAHKTVLAASSSVFSDIMKNNKHSLPYIYLRGVTSDQLSSMINFIYYGETTVKEEEFESFTALGKEFQIDGLQSLTFEEESQSNDTDKKMKELEELLSKDSRDFPSDKGEKLKEIVNDLETFEASIKSKPEAKKIVSPKSSGDANKSEDEKVSNEFELAINNKIEFGKTTDGTRIFQCTDCLKPFKTKQKAKFHVEIHLDGFSHTCQQCGASLKTKHSLTMHTYKLHTRNSSLENKGDSFNI